MISLFNINNYNVDTSTFGNHLVGHYVAEFERKFAEYVGAKHACSFSSATSAIFLALRKKNIQVEIPSVIPPVVLNAIINSENSYRFNDDVKWVGWSYILHNFGDYKIIDSAQRVDKNQFAHEANDEDLMIFSFYPTKPIGSIDGGMIVSNDWEKIRYFKEAAYNGMSLGENSWERDIVFPGWKMYMNSFQAFVALQNLVKLDAKKHRLAEIRAFYNAELGLENRSHHLYRISVQNRDDLMLHLKREGITCGVHYRAMHKHPVYSLGKVVLPNSELCDRTTMSIPFHEKLSDTDVQKIVNRVRAHGKFCASET